MDRSPRGNPYRDLDRPPLSEPALRAALVRPGELWSELRIVAETGSTNADLVAAGADAADGTVLIAESQLAGRGRADRTWIAPARAGVTMSVLLRPAVRRQRWGWLPLLAGVAVAEALEAVAMIEVALKWPNDVLAGPGRRKVCGILVQVTGQATGQVTGSAVVIGIGLNVSTTAAELPVVTATSLALEESGCLDRDTLVRAVLRALARQYAGWCAAAGDPDASGSASGVRIPLRHDRRRCQREPARWRAAAGARDRCRRGGPAAGRDERRRARGGRGRRRPCPSGRAR